jgi:LacI family transcriptional regulator
MIKKNVTLKDIAAECDLSKTAVSYILNNDPDYRVSDHTRDKVKKTAEKLGYRPSYSARSLVSRKYNTIGVLFYNTRSLSYAELLQKIDDALAKAGYGAIYAFWESIDEVESAFESILNRGVDGIITCHEDHTLIPDNVPAVLLYSKNDNYDCVYFDAKESLRIRLSHLLGLGHKDIAYLCKDPDREQKEVIAECFGEKGLKPDFNLSFGKDNGFAEDGYQAMLELIESRCKATAVLCRNDDVALGAISAAHKHGIRVPEDLSIVGFDNIELGKYSSPQLTTYGMNNDRLAAILVDMIVKRLKKPKDAVSQIEMDCRLVVRDSTAQI